MSNFISRLVAVFLTFTFSAAFAVDAIDWNRIPTLDELKAVKFVPRTAPAGHKAEKRGYVKVPFDYSRPEGPTLEIFYRLIPSLDFTDKPVLVVINGGPGIPSSAYQPYDFNYDDAATVATSRFYHLRKNFRILFADQRGTDGFSAPVDLNDEKLNPAIIARYFDSEEIARDYERVINEVLPAEETFVLLGQSYAGHVVSHYLSLDGIKRLPKAAVFTSAITPHADPHGLHVFRRTEQLNLNKSLLAKYPKTPEQFQALRVRFTACKMDPQNINHLWNDLGRGKDGEWQANMVKTVDRLIKSDCKEIEEEIKKRSANVALMNYILSSACLNPGETDRTSAAKMQKEIPFEPWMLDEAWANAQIGIGSPKWFLDLLDAIDANPPPQVSFLPEQELKKKFASHKIPILFTFGTGDAYLPLQFQAPEVMRYAEFPLYQLRILPGGHSAAFQEAGAATLVDWLK